MTKFFAESCQSQNFRTFCSVHGRKKPYECEICIKFFFLQGKLSRHIALIHDGKKAYKCDVFDKFFLLIDNLVRHFISVHFFLLKGSPKEFRWFYHEGKKPNNVRFVTIFSLNLDNLKIFAVFALFMEGRSPMNVRIVTNSFF